MDVVTIPNPRKLIIPDPGYTIYECDLKGADAQVVAWDSEDEDLKAAFRTNVDVHSKNAEDMWGSAFTSLPADSMARHKKRQSCKHAVHGTNYGSTPQGLSHHPAIGWTVHEADQFQKRWFSLHPKIGPITRPGSWHFRTQAQLDKNNTIRNAFGHQRVFFGRPSESFTEALAWKPQCTVAIVCFEGAMQLEERLPDVQMLLNNHDSNVFQRPSSRDGEIASLIAAMEIIVPYPDPLIIPWEVKMSHKSWGECEKVKV